MAGPQVVINIVGDVSQLQRSLRDGSGSLDKFAGDASSSGDRLTSVGSKLTLGLTGPLVAGLGMAAKAAADEGQEMALLANTLQNTTGATDAQIAAVEEWITATQNATGVSDGQLRPAMQRLLEAGRSVEQSQADMAVALDIAAAKGTSVEAVTTAMGKAALGNVGALGRLGVATKNAAGETLTYDQVLANAAETMGGAAAKAADTTAGKAAITQAKMADLAETVGQSVVPVMETVATVGGKVADMFAGLPAPVQTGVVALAGVAAATGPILTVVGNVQKLSSSVSGAGTAIASMASGPLVLGIGAIAAFGAAMVAAGESIDSQLSGVIDELAEKTDGELVDAFDAGGRKLEEFEAIADQNIGTAIRLRDELERQGEETTELDKIIDGHVEAQKNAETSTKAAASALVEEGDAAEETASSLQSLLDATLAQFNADLAYQQQVNKVEDAIGAVNDAMSEKWETEDQVRRGTEALQRATLDAAQAILGQAAAAGELAVKNSGVTDETDKARIAAAYQKGELEKVAATLAPGSPLRKQLDQYIFTLSQLDGKVVTTTIETVYVGRNEDGSVVRRKDARDKGASPAGKGGGRATGKGEIVETSYGSIHLDDGAWVRENGQTRIVGEQPITINLPKPRKGEKLDAEEVYAALREAERRHGRLKIKTVG